MAKGYWVSVYEDISNPDGLAEYAKLAGPAVAAHGGQPLARGGKCIAKEGMPANRTVLIEFDSFATAQAAYESDAYQAALEKLQGAAKRHFRIIEGV